MGIAAQYRKWSDADKAGLKELKAEMETKTGGPVKLQDAIKAVEPGEETPAYLANC